APAGAVLDAGEDPAVLTVDGGVEPEREEGLLQVVAVELGQVGFGGWVGGGHLGLSLLPRCYYSFCLIIERYTRFAKQTRSAAKRWFSLRHRFNWFHPEISCRAHPSVLTLLCQDIGHDLDHHEEHQD